MSALDELETAHPPLHDMPGQAQATEGDALSKKEKDVIIHDSILHEANGTPDKTVADTNAERSALEVQSGKETGTTESAGMVNATITSEQENIAIDSTEESTDEPSGSAIEDIALTPPAIDTPLVEDTDITETTAPGSIDKGTLPTEGAVADEGVETFMSIPQLAAEFVSGTDVHSSPANAPETSAPDDSAQAVNEAKPVAEDTPTPEPESLEEAAPAVNQVPAEEVGQVSTTPTFVVVEEPTVTPELSPVTEQSTKGDQGVTGEGDSAHEMPVDEPHVEIFCSEQTPPSVEQAASDVKEVEIVSTQGDSPAAEDEASAVSEDVLLLVDSKQLADQEVPAAVADTVSSSQDVPGEPELEAEPSAMVAEGPSVVGNSAETVNERTVDVEPETLSEKTLGETSAPASTFGEVAALMTVTEPPVEESLAPAVVDIVQGPKEDLEQTESSSVAEPEHAPLAVQEAETVEDVPVAGPTTVDVAATTEEVHPSVPGEAPTTPEAVYEAVAVVEESVVHQTAASVEGSVAVAQATASITEALQPRTEDIPAVHEVPVPAAAPKILAVEHAEADVEAKPVEGSDPAEEAAVGDGPPAAEVPASPSGPVPDASSTEPVIALGEPAEPSGFADDVTPADNGDLATVEIVPSEKLADQETAPEDPHGETASHSEEPTAVVLESPAFEVEETTVTTEILVPISIAASTKVEDTSATVVVEPVDNSAAVEKSHVLASEESVIPVVIPEPAITAEELPVEGPVAEVDMPVAETVVEADQEEENNTAEAPVVEEGIAEPVTIGAMPVIEDAGVIDIAVEGVVVSAERTATEVEMPVVSIDAVGDTLEQSELTAESVTESRSPSLQEHPKSPWTPSYIVTTQGPGTSGADEEEIVQLDQLPPAAEETFANPQVQVTTEPLDEVELPSGVVEPDRPKSPFWVPSYSVSSQGTSPLHSPSITAANLHEEVLPISVADPDAAAPLVPSLEESAPSELGISLIEIEVPAQSSSSEKVTAVSSEEHIVEEEEVPAGAKLTEADEVPAVDIPTIATEEADAIEPSEQSQAAPWIPSYSVSSQGSSPSHTPHETAPNSKVAEIDPLPERTVEVGITHEELPIPVTDVALATVLDVVPMTESGEILAVEPQAALAVGSDAAPVVVEAPYEPFADEAPALVIETATEDIAESQTPPPASDGNEETKSPWTPSYSVTHQGNSPLASPARSAHELEEVEHLSPPAQAQRAETPVVIEDTAVPSVVVETVISNGDETNEPTRPWTPSYSVTRQGSGSVIDTDKDSNVDIDIENKSESTDVEKDMEVAPETSDNLHGFPVIDETTKVAAKPSLARLAPVDENKQILITEPSLGPIEVSPPNPRARLESTTSSRFFPGGWFSSTTKLPEEGRASLENATGEFARTPSETVATPTLEVPVNTPIDGDVDYKKRQRWCVIM